LDRPVQQLLSLVFHLLLQLLELAVSLLDLFLAEVFLEGLDELAHLAGQSVELLTGNLRRL
jgi:hypothetical protein